MFELYVFVIIMVDDFSARQQSILCSWTFEAVGVTAVILVTDENCITLHFDHNFYKDCLSAVFFAHNISCPVGWCRWFHFMIGFSQHIFTVIVIRSVMSQKIAICLVLSAKLTTCLVFLLFYSYIQF